MKRCAWISRHLPMKEQRVSLAAYQIYQINPPGRLWSASDAILLSQAACKGWPDLFVVVMPMLMLQYFVEEVGGRVPVVRGVYNTIGEFSWTGRWEEVVSVNVVRKEWSPSGRQMR